MGAAAGGGPMNPSAITIAEAAQPRKRLCKLWRMGPSGTATCEDYSEGLAFFVFTEIPMPADIGEMGALMAGIARRPDLALVYGEPVFPRQQVRRWLEDRPEGPATLREVPRDWLALDIDSVADINGTFANDPFGTVVRMVDCMLPELRGAGLVVMLSASAAMKPGIRARVFARLAEPMMPSAMKRWALAQNSITPRLLDTSIYTGNQLIYVATPIFVGMDDPLPHRVAVRAGGRVALTVPQDEPGEAASTSAVPAVTSMPGEGWTRFLDALEPGAVHSNLLRAAASLVTSRPCRNNTEIAALATETWPTVRAAIEALDPMGQHHPRLREYGAAHWRRCIQRYALKDINNNKTACALLRSVMEHA